MRKLGIYWASLKSWLDHTWGNHLLDQWINTVMIMVHFGFGLVLLFSHPLTFGSKTYEPIVTLSQGHLWLWGVVIIFSGYLMAMPYKWLNVVGLWIGMAWMATWTSLFIWAVLSYPEASPLLVIACGGFAMINASLLTARVINTAPFGG